MQENIQPSVREKIGSAVRTLKHFNHSPFWKTRQGKYISSIIVNVSLIFLVLISATSAGQSIISPLPNNQNGSLQSLQKGKGGYEVFGFAPYWNFNKMNNVNFN